MKTGRARGSVSVEVALLIPVFILVAAMFTASWRVWWAKAQVQAAAQAGARAASTRLDVKGASAVVDQVVSADLATVGLHCADISRVDDLAAVALPVGVPGTVSVSISCKVALGDLLLPGLPGSITVQGQGREAIDVFRRR